MMKLKLHRHVAYFLLFAFTGLQWVSVTSALCCCVWNGHLVEEVVTQPVEESSCCSVPETESSNSQNHCELPINTDSPVFKTHQGEEFCACCEKMEPVDFERLVSTSPRLEQEKQVVDVITFHYTQLQFKKVEPALQKPTAKKLGFPDIIQTVVLRN